MIINLNKDPQDFKNEFAWGFTIFELLCLVITGVIVIGVGVLIWILFKPYPVICVYAALPCGVPSMILGFYKKQGKTLFKYWKDVSYHNKTSDLEYRAGELTEAPFVWSMKLDEGQKGKKR